MQGYQQPIFPYVYRNPNQNSNDLYILKVIGEGIINVQPNESNIILGVSTENRELQKAQAENTEKMAQVQSALKQIGISGDQIRTTDYSIYPQYDFSEGGQQFRGYKVDHLMNITVQDIRNVGLVVDTAVRNGANTVRNISFSLTDSSKAYREALSLAVEDANHKALTIANSLKVKLIPTPTSVTEITQSQTSPIPFAASQPFVKGAVSTPIEPGKLEIIASIQAIYQYYL